MSDRDFRAEYKWLSDRLQAEFPDAQITDQINDYGFSYAIGVMFGEGASRWRTYFRAEYVERDIFTESAEAASGNEVVEFPTLNHYSLNDDPNREMVVANMIRQLTIAAAGVKSMTDGD